MPRWLVRAAFSLLLLPLLAPGFDAFAASSEDLQRLKSLQQWQLINEPAERAEKLKKRLKRYREWQKAQKRNPGSRIKLPTPAALGDLARGRRPDFFSGARPAARRAIAAFNNSIANDTTGEPEGSCQSEVSIAAIGNNVLAAWNDGIGVYTGNPHFQGYAWSTDGGLTWTDGGVPPTGGIGQWSSDPVLAANPRTGDFYFSALADQAFTSGVGVVRGRFSGGSFVWDAPTLAVQLSTSTNCPDKNWIAADSLTGNVYVSYTHFRGPCSGPTSDDIAIVRSTDGGLTWSSPTVLSAPSDAGFVQGSRPAVGPDGELYVVWHAIGQIGNSAYGRDFLRIRKSTNGGVSFGAQVTVDSIFSNWGSGGPGFNRGRGITFPGIAVDCSNGPRRGRVYVTWSEAVDFYADDFPVPGGAPAQNERESNDDASLATGFTPGTILRGVVSQPEDLDYWKWNAVQGRTYAFWLDSLYSNLDASFRVFSTTGGTNLAFSQNGFGGQDFIVFTAPTTDTYHLRVGSYTGSQTGRYRIVSVTHTPHPFDRARDHRDVFSRYSNDGITWGPVVRVNDSPGFYDDYLPEIAVDAGGRVFVAYFDWRDARPEEQGGASSAYLYRSDDGATTWNGGVRIQNEATNWTAVYSTLIPNQGDYIALATSDSTVYVGWAEGRGTNPDPDVYVAGTKLNCASAPITVVSSEAGPDSVVVTWSAPDGITARLYRRQGSGAWVDLGPVVASGGGIVYQDTSVLPGQTYAYRLGVTGYCQDFIGQVSISVPVPAGPSLRIFGTRPNPTRDQVVVAFQLPVAGPARIALYDIGGREVHSVDLSGLGAGAHVVNVSQGIALRSGIYFVRLTQNGLRAEKRVAVFP